MEHASLIAILRRRACEDPGRPAFRFVDGGSQEPELTYHELDQRARALGALLQSVGQKGDRVLLLYPAGLEFVQAFFGCLYAGFVAVPAPPPESMRAGRYLTRIESIATDARPTVVLTSSGILSSLGDLLERVPALDRLRWLPTDSLDVQLADEWEEPAGDGAGLCYLQYTSGSTSTPKGVMVSHRALLHNAEQIRRAWGYVSESISVMWVPNFHDDGLVHGIVQPVYAGCTCVLMPPLTIVQRPVEWLRTISRFRATHAGGPNFAYALAVRKTTLEERSGLNLGSWSMAYNAAEPVRRETLEQFHQAFEPHGFRWSSFYPSFGLAEATLLVTTGRPGAGPVFRTVEAAALERENRVVLVDDGAPGSRSIVGCGRPVDHAGVAIVHPESLERCAPGEVGEIWISTPAAADGYWNLPGPTERALGARIAGSDEGPFLRTGDLGFLEGDELFVTGRLKDLIILRGRNLYPQDIELTAEKSHPAARPGCTAAFSVEVDGEEKVVVVQEVDASTTTDPGDAIENIRRSVAEEHELPVHAVALILPRTLPKTSSGKIQRYGCRSAFLSGELELVRQWPSSSVREPERITAPGVAMPVVTAAAPGERARGGGRADGLIDWLRAFASERLNSRLIDERRSIPPHVVLELGNHGLLGMQVPEVYGGIALGHLDALRIYQQLAAIDLTIASFVSGHNALGLTPILRHADRSLREELVPSLARGRELASFALTEPGAGSNPRAMTARVRHTPGGWRLHGEKSWIGTAAWAGVINVFVQHPEYPREGGVSGFVVRQGSPGLRLGPEAMTMGLRGMVQSTVYLEGVPVDRGHLLGQPGGGMDVAQDTMMSARLCLGAIAVGGMKRCAQLMLRYASGRSVSTGRLLDNPLSLIRLSDLTAAITALEALVGRTAEMLDQGRSVSVDAFLSCKIAGAELLWQAADSLVQLLGGRGYVETNLAPQILRDARIFRIVEGPTEALGMFLGTRAIHEREEIAGFLRVGLGAPQVAERWREVVAAVQARSSGPGAPFSERPVALRWGYALAGEVTVEAFLWAAVQGSPQGSLSIPLGAAAEWARARFERVAARLSSPAPGEAASVPAHTAAESIAAYARDIGEVEQGAAGEGIGMDGALRLAPSSQAQPVSAPIQVAPVPSSPASPAARRSGRGPGLHGRDTEAAISSWLIEWIARQTGQAAHEIDARKPFAYHGLDSLSAVMLLEDLGSWLRRPVAPTLVWAHPTVELLAHHLAGTELTNIGEPVSEGVSHG